MKKKKQNTQKYIHENTYTKIPQRKNTTKNKQETLKQIKDIEHRTKLANRS